MSRDQAELSPGVAAAYRRLFPIFDALGICGTPPSVIEGAPDAVLATDELLTRDVHSLDVEEGRFLALQEALARAAELPEEFRFGD